MGNHRRAFARATKTKLRAPAADWNNRKNRKRSTEEIRDNRKNKKRSPEEIRDEEVQDLADKFGVEASIEIASDGKPVILVTHRNGETTPYDDTEEMYRDLSDEVGRRDFGEKSRFVGRKSCCPRGGLGSFPLAFGAKRARFEVLSTRNAAIF